MKDMLKTVEQKMQKEMETQVDMIYSAVAIALHRWWGWGALRIRRLFGLTQTTWDECAGSNEVSMLEMVENEVGIEIRIPETDKSWNDLAFLNAKIDMGRMTKC